MYPSLRGSALRLLRFFSYGSVVSVYILIVIGGYVTTSNSGGACGETPGEGWPLCNGGLFPNWNNAAQVIEFTHRIFNFAVAFFVLGTAVLAWTRYRQADRVVLFSTASFIGLFAQVILGMATVTSALNPVVSDAHLALASAVFGLVLVNAVTVWNMRSDLLEIRR